MRRARLRACAWEGFIAALIAGGTALTTLGAWPTRYQWLTVLAGGAVAGGKAVQAYQREAK